LESDSFISAVSVWSFLIIRTPRGDTRIGSMPGQEDSPLVSYVDHEEPQKVMILPRLTWLRYSIPITTANPAG
jgi:hypothetical protein